MTTNNEFGRLCDYKTGTTLRAATEEELRASLAAADEDGGRGVIDVDGRSVYVEGGELEAEMVVIEEMPDHLRASHRAAGNWGVYPHNGAERREVSREEAEELIAADEDGYTHIVG